MITVAKDSLNRVRFYLNGSQVFPIHISGNLATFENGETILF